MQDKAGLSMSRVNISGQEASMSEALANCDKKFLRSQSTNPVKFINAHHFPTLSKTITIDS